MHIEPECIFCLSKALYYWSYTSRMIQDLRKNWSLLWILWKCRWTWLVACSCIFEKKKQFWILVDKKQIVLTVRSVEYRVQANMKNRLRIKSVSAFEHFPSEVSKLLYICVYWKLVALWAPIIIIQIAINWYAIGFG